MTLTGQGLVRLDNQFFHAKETGFDGQFVVLLPCAFAVVRCRLSAQASQKYIFLCCIDCPLGVRVFKQLQQVLLASLPHQASAGEGP